MRFNNVRDGVLNICNELSKNFPELMDEIKALRLEIRNASKGAAIKDAQETPTTFTVTTEGAEASDAQLALLRDAFRKLAAITHPDRPGGSAELFDEVRRAYKNRDLHFLIELYITLVKSRNLWWITSQEAKEYVQTQTARPKVLLARLRSTSEFQVMQLFMSGRKEEAKNAIHNYMLMLKIALHTELQHVLRTNIARSKVQSSDNDEDSVVNSAVVASTLKTQGVQ